MLTKGLCLFVIASVAVCTCQAQMTGGNSNGPAAPTQISWVVVDSMQNAHSMASTTVEPLVFDPSTNTLALIHRGESSYGASGQVWYNMSTNGGTNWVRVSELNAGTSAQLRYPTCAISNPTNSPSRGNAFFWWVAPRFVSGAWGGMTYGVDAPLGSGTPYAVAAPDSGVPSSVILWTCEQSDAVFWAYRRINGFGIYVCGPYFCGVPPSWWVSADPIAGTFVNGVVYLGAHGNLPNTTRWNIGYSKSTDLGRTWSDWVCPGVDAPRYSWWDANGSGAYSFAMTVDANNRVHFFGVVVNSLTQQRALLELCESAVAWEAKFVTTNLSENTCLNYGDITNMGHYVNVATNTSRTDMVVEWLDAGSPIDTLPDIWLSSRHINQPDWYSALNITNSPDRAELLVHMAPVTTYQPIGGLIFFTRAYQAGIMGYPPSPGDRTVIYSGRYTVIVLHAADPPAITTDYRLAQNYPNPFNPETRIGFRIRDAGFTSLKVYDVLGREVATLVEGKIDAGNHEVTFDGSNLPSGVYVYRLMSGSYQESKKMLLMK